jgi:hypothetical protein
VKAAKAPKAPRACKYGPRDADGRCPPRPKLSDAERKAKRLAAAAERERQRQEELGPVGRFLEKKIPTPGRDRKISSVIVSGTSKLAGNVAVEIAKESAKQKLPWGDIVKALGSAVATWSLPIAAVIFGGYAGAKVRSLGVAERVRAELARVEKSIKRPLTEQERAQLIPQYVKFFNQREAEFLRESMRK